MGKIGFENLVVLTRFLSRTGKDAAGPREVRLSIQADTKFETIVAIVAACKAAGLQQPASVKIDKLKSELKLVPNTTNAVEFIKALESAILEGGPSDK